MAKAQTKESNVLNTYYVDPNRNLEHDGVPYTGGQPIELTESEAAPLLAGGIVLADEPIAEVKENLEEARATVVELTAENATLRDRVAELEALLA